HPGARAVALAGQLHQEDAQHEADDQAHDGDEEEADDAAEAAEQQGQVGDAGAFEVAARYQIFGGEPQRQHNGRGHADGPADRAGATEHGPDHDPGPAQQQAREHGYEHAEDADHDG